MTKATGRREFEWAIGSESVDLLITASTLSNSLKSAYSPRGVTRKDKGFPCKNREVTAA